VAQQEALASRGRPVSWHEYVFLALWILWGAARMEDWELHDEIMDELEDL